MRTPSTSNPAPNSKSHVNLRDLWIDWHRPMSQSSTLWMKCARRQSRFLAPGEKKRSEMQLIWNESWQNWCKTNQDITSKWVNLFVCLHEKRLRTYLTTNSIGRWPQRIIFLHNLRIDNDPLELFHNGVMNVRLFADHCVIFVVGIVCVPQFAVRSKFEFQKFMAEFTFVTNVITKIEVFCGFGHDSFTWMFRFCLESKCNGNSG